MNPLIQSIIQQLKDIQNGRPWIGNTFDRNLSQLDESWVFKRPFENLHSIAEIISHLTLWRKEAILKVETGTGSKTDDCAENWLSNEALEVIGWKQIKATYDNTLSDLIALLETKDDSFLDEQYYDTDFKGNYPYSFVIYGMLHHDIYHLGQMALILKFLKEQNV